MRRSCSDDEMLQEEHYSNVFKFRFSGDKDGQQAILDFVHTLVPIAFPNINPDILTTSEPTA